MSYNQLGVLTTQLPQGPESDSFLLTLLVYIYDDRNGHQAYSLSTPVQVNPNLERALISMDMIINTSAGRIAADNFTAKMFSNNMHIVAQNVIGLSSSLNYMSSLVKQARVAIIS